MAETPGFPLTPDAGSEVTPAVEVEAPASVPEGTPEGSCDADPIAAVEQEGESAAEPVVEQPAEPVLEAAAASLVEPMHQPAPADLAPQDAGAFEPVVDVSATTPDAPASAVAAPEPLAHEPLAPEAVPAPLSSPPQDSGAWNAPTPEPAAEPAAAVASASEVSPAPVVEPAQEPAGDTTAQPQPPTGIASSLEIPALEGATAGEGGEFDLLVGKVRAWLEEADLPSRWESLGGPLRGLGLLLGAVVVLRLYSALLETLGDLPLLPRLLQLVGLIALLRFALTRFVRTSERQKVLALWKERWNDFRGRA